MSRTNATLVFCCYSALFSLVVALSCAPVQATELFWDINGATPGAGGATPAGTWATNVANWSTDSTGSSATAAWNNTNNQATFAAGTDATGGYVVTIGSGGVAPTATQTVTNAGIRVNSGQITFNGGVLTLNSINFGGGFEIAPAASVTFGTSTFNRTGTQATFSYLFGGGSINSPGFTAFPGGAHYIVPVAGTWDFDSAATLGVNRVIALSGSLANPSAVQGNGTFSRPLLNGNGGVYWTGGSGGGFAARGGQLDVSITSTVTFGVGAVSPGNGAPLVLGSPSADSLVNYQTALNLGTANQNILTWNPNNNPGNVARISGVISSGAGGALTKVGTGTLQLTATNTYSGGTTVDTGTLLLNNTTGSATGTGNVVVNVNGTLGGTGSASGSVSVFGTLAPGESTESLNTGSLTMQTASTLEIEIGGLTPGVTLNGYDVVNVTGSVALNDANLDLSLVGGFAPAKYDTFFIVSNDGADAVSGIFGGLANDSILNTGGFLWRVRYNVDFGTLNFALGSGNDIALQALPIPEPSTCSLLVVSGVCCIARRRWRRTARG